MKMLTRHQRLFVDAVLERYGALPPEKLVVKLCETGVIDQTRCKILAVRHRVDDLARGGRSKLDAMNQAAEEFCVTYEYVRKCIYNYKDVNLS